MARYPDPYAERTFGIDGPGTVAPIDRDLGRSDVDVLPDDDQPHGTAAREARVGDRDRNAPENSKPARLQTDLERTREAEVDVPIVRDAEEPGNIDIDDPEEIQRAIELDGKVAVFHTDYDAACGVQNTEEVDRCGD